MEEEGGKGWRGGWKKQTLCVRHANPPPHHSTPQVRANTLQELIYKQGQAGVTKASVSIVFDNSDKSASPAGYDHVDTLTVTRQLVVGGRNKYLVNGHAAQPSRVANLFHSVGLNVNAPHFLIMQGRITKVLNAAPADILAMLGEAAGTRMYESKKEAALRTLARKGVKVGEIGRVLGEEVVPALDRLRSERAAYVAWREGAAALAALQRLCIAYKWVAASTVTSTAAGIVAAAAAKAAELGAEAEAAQADARALAAAVADAESEREAAAGGAARELAAAADAAAKRAARDRATAAAARDAAEGAAATVARLETAVRRAGADDAAARADAAATDAASAAAAAAAAEDAVVAAERGLAGARAGDGRDASNRSLAQRAADARVRATDARAARDAAVVRADAAAGRVATARKQVEAARAKGGDTAAAELAAADAAVASARAALAAVAHDAAAHDAAVAAADEAASAATAAADKAAAARASLAGLDFVYAHPGGDFDAARVRGPLARLVTVSDPGAASALEVVAGGRLFHMVVEDDVTATALLARGRLRSRVTIVPLNRVSGSAARGLSSGARAAASSSSGAAVPALELVAPTGAGLEAALHYAFGGAIVTNDRATAQRIAFGPPASRARCVTREGDDFNPGGTLTGGSRSAGGRVLAALGALADADAAARAAADAAHRAATAVEAGAAAAAAHAAAAADLDLAMHARDLAAARAAGGGAAAAAVAALADAEAALAAAVADRDAAAAAEDVALQEAADLDASAAALAADAAGAVAAAEAALAAARAAVGPARDRARARPPAPPTPLPPSGMAPWRPPRTRAPPWTERALRRQRLPPQPTPHAPPPPPPTRPPTPPPPPWTTTAPPCAPPTQSCATWWPAATPPWRRRQRQRWRAERWTPTRRARRATRTRRPPQWPLCRPTTPGSRRMRPPLACPGLRTISTPTWAAQTRLSATSRPPKPRTRPPVAPSTAASCSCWTERRASTPPWPPAKPL